VRVIIRNNATFMGSNVHDFEGGGFAFVVDVGFVGHPEE
jgi:hypothetical protein